MPEPKHDLLKDARRDSGGLPWLEGAFQDLRFALRRLGRDRGVTLVAIVVLALAVGLNVSAFTVMSAAVYRGFPLVEDNDRLVYIQEVSPLGLCCIGYMDFEDWRSQATTFEDMAFVAERPVTLREGERSYHFFPFTVSAKTFKLLGVQPMLGRDFAPTDEGPGVAPVAVISYGFWESWFSKRDDIVGLPVFFDGVPATIIGVMPEGFEFPYAKEAWMVLPQTPELRQRGFTSSVRGPGGYFAVGRLRDGVDMEAARSELEAINRRLEEAYPDTNSRLVPSMKTHSQFFVGPDALTIYGSLWVAAWFILIIACANLTNLMLVRTTGRRELSTRIALGASPGRMIRQVILESLVIAGGAGVLGYWIARWSLRAWAVATPSPYQVFDYTVDSSTLAYLFATSVAAAILFSLVPIIKVWQLGRTGALRSDAHGVTPDPRGKRLAAVAVAVQMALAVLLLSGAGVLVGSFWNIVNAENGVRDPENILVGSVRLPPERYPSAETWHGYFEELETQLESIPGIAHGAVASRPPLDWGAVRKFEVEGRPRPEGGETIQFLAVGSDYFKVIGVSPIFGREFNAGDGQAALPVAIVNQSFVDGYWSGEQPLGKRLRAEDGEWRVVVAVVPNIMQGAPIRQQFKPLIYVPFRQEVPSVGTQYFFAQASVPPVQVAQTVRAEIEKVDPGLTLLIFTTLDTRLEFRAELMDLERSELGKNAVVAPIFAVIALLLAALGLYAVLAYSINQRTQEIGVRMAIGATVADIRKMVLREGMLPVAIGVILGLASSLAVNRVLQSQLVGISPNDPATMAGALGFLILVALLACQIPARRASNVDPAVALRYGVDQG